MSLSAQLKLALTRDPRIPQQSPTPEEKNVTPSMAVINLVDGAKGIPTQNDPSSTTSLKPGSLIQAHLFPAPPVPKLKSDTLSGKSLPPLLTPAGSSVAIELCGRSWLLQTSLSSNKPPPLIKMPCSKKQSDSSVQKKGPVSSLAPALLNKAILSPPTSSHDPPVVAKEDSSLHPPKPKKPKAAKTGLLPLSRVKTIMKTNIQSSQPNLQLSQDSVLLITKATVSSLADCKL